MKYLKRFENIDDNSEIISELRDILQDLEDEYFDVILGNKKFFVDRNKQEIQLLHLSWFFKGYNWWFGC